MNKIILHIPHASKELPQVFWENTCQNRETIERFIDEITDIDTDVLFAGNDYEKIVFPYSRVFCDVEKFDNDDMEPMSRFGMGVVYSKTNLGEIFRTYDKEYSEYVLRYYYFPYHRALDKQVEEQLQTADYVVLIDCHAFSKDIVMNKEKQIDLPDICIGFNGEEDELAKLCIQFFEGLHYTVKSNDPYSGAMIPNRFISQPNEKLKTVMIEINKELYRENPQAIKRIQGEINRLFKKIELLKF